MTINVRKRSGKRYLAKHGLRKVFLDGVEAPSVWYVDNRRKVARAYVRDASGRPVFDPAIGKAKSVTIQARTIKLVPVAV